MLRLYAGHGNKSGVVRHIGRSGSTVAKNIMNKEGKFIMKKMFSLVLVILMCASLCACGLFGGNNQGSNSSDSVAAGAAVPGDSIGNVVSQNNYNTTAPVENVSFQNVNLGTQITLDFLEMTFDTVSYAQELKPTDTSSVYSYYADKENEQYFYLSGSIKNIGGAGYSVDNIVSEIVIDNKYTYNAHLIADNGGNDFYGDYVKPFGGVKYYIYASVPDELLNQYSTVTFRFGFKNNFSGSYYDDFDECNYLYQLSAMK